MGDYSNPGGALTFTQQGQLVGAGPNLKPTYVTPYVLVDLFGSDPSGTVGSDTAISTALSTLPIRILNGNQYRIGELWFGPNKLTSTNGGNSRGGYMVNTEHDLGPFVTLRGPGIEACTIYCVDNGLPVTFFTMRTPDGYISDPDTSNAGGIIGITLDGRYSTGQLFTSNVYPQITSCSSTGSPTTLQTSIGHKLSSGQLALAIHLGAGGGNDQAVCNGIWTVTVVDTTHVTIPANNTTSATPSGAFLVPLGPVGLDYGEMHGIILDCRVQHFAAIGAVGLLERNQVAGGGAGCEKMHLNTVTLTNNTFGHYRTSTYASIWANDTYTPGVATWCDLANGGGLPGLTIQQINGSASPVTAGTAITSIKVTTGSVGISSAGNGDLIRLAANDGTGSEMWLAAATTVAPNTTATVNLVATNGHASHIGGPWKYTIAKLNGGSSFNTTTTAAGTNTTKIPVTSTSGINPGQTAQDATTGFAYPMIVTDVDPSLLLVTITTPVSFASGDTITFAMPVTTYGGQTALQFDAGAAGQFIGDNGSYEIFGNASTGAGSGTAVVVGINTGPSGGSGSTWYGTDLKMTLLSSGGWGSQPPQAFNVTGANPAYWVGNASINLQPQGGTAWTASTGVINNSGSAGSAGLFTCWSGQAANGDSTLNSKVNVTLGSPSTLTNAITTPMNVTLGPGEWLIELEGNVKGGPSSTQNIELWLGVTNGTPYASGTTLDMAVVQPALSQWLPFRLKTTQLVTCPNGGTTTTFYLNTQSSASNSAVLEAVSPVNSFAKITRITASPV